ncbi:MAG: hypothetical protein IKC56_01505, partial [Clostridia bacterium]|nr:hypothetical protein [Clostridia bacterium]
MKNFFSTVVSLSLLSGVAGLIAWIAGTSWGLTVLLVSVGVLLLSAVVLSSITDAEEQAKLAAMSPEEREKYEAEKAAEKKEKIQQAEHQKHVKKSQNFSTADVKSVLRLLDSGSGWKWCPICDAKLNYIEGYQIERVVNVAKP